MSELWGAYEGLKLTWMLGYTKVELHMDLEIAVKQLTVQLVERLVAVIEGVLSKQFHAFWKLMGSHMCADALANLGCFNQCQFAELEHVLVQLSQLLLADVMGVFTPRIVYLYFHSLGLGLIYSPKKKLSFLANANTKYIITYGSLFAYSHGHDFF